MRIHVESEIKREKLVDSKVTTDEAGAEELALKYEIEHLFYVRVVDPKSIGWSPTDAFNVLAAMLPPGTEVGDEFKVFFERCPRGHTPTYPPVPSGVSVVEER